MTITCSLCKSRPADHMENGRSRHTEPYPVCHQCGQEMDRQEHGLSPLDRRHYTTKTPLPVSAGE